MSIGVGGKINMEQKYLRRAKNKDFQTVAFGIFSIKKKSTVTYTSLYRASTE
jgi:hypothetical protein